MYGDVELWLGEKNMVFMKCVRAVDGGLEYLVGQNQEALLSATEGGLKHSGLSYSSYEFVAWDRVPVVKLRRYDEARKAILGGTVSFWIGIVGKLGGD